MNYILTEQHGKKIAVILNGIVTTKSYPAKYTGAVN